MPAGVEDEAPGRSQHRQSIIGGRALSPEVAEKLDVMVKRVQFALEEIKHKDNLLQQQRKSISHAQVQPSPGILSAGPKHAPYMLSHALCRMQSGGQCPCLLHKTVRLWCFGMRFAWSRVALPYLLDCITDASASRPPSFPPACLPLLSIGHEHVRHSVTQSVTLFHAVT